MPGSDLHVVLGQDLSEEESFLPDSEPKVRRAELVDPAKGVGPVPVGTPEPGRIACFLDGIERTHVPLYVSMVPVVYGYVAAAIRTRGEDRRMRTLGSPSTSEALYYPRRLVDCPAFESAGIRVVDTESNEKQIEEHPAILREAARVAISKARGRLETDLSRGWLEEFDGGDVWLLVDGSLGGTLGGDYRKYRAPNIVGLVKSHQTQYFPMEEQRKILALRMGERSGLFRPMDRQQRAPVHSWYLRLRPNDGQDIYFGLVRLEVSADCGTEETADGISRWLLAERCPLSLPDSRWDRMPYPIRDCEQYLKSIAPSRTMLAAAMSGLARGV